MTRREEIEHAAMQVGGVHPDWDALECFQMGYKEGAKWADRTMIEKATQWLFENVFYYPDESDNVELFRKAMEE